MAAATTIAAIGLGITALSSLNSANQQALAIADQAAFSETQMNINADNAEAQAKDAKRRGDEDAGRLQTATRKLMGEQRVGLAAEGRDTTSGDALDLITETQTIGFADEVKARNNAWREAWGYKTEAANMRAQGAMTRSAADKEAKNTLLTGGLNFAGGIARAYGGFGKTGKV